MLASQHTAPSGILVSDIKDVCCCMCRASQKSCDKFIDLLTPCCVQGAEKGKDKLHTHTHTQVHTYQTHKWQAVI